ncbi:MAG: NADH-quinone oxidoreductase subunit C [Chloroflexi bacterium]|nr:NADH-quinone oxidoreductase subunit C [Chloroflexota bacterium]MCL5107734.1 NADH-quinone oxidoreductase subunit C [Chloroflexota bacterium]
MTTGEQPTSALRPATIVPPAQAPARIENLERIPLADLLPRVRAMAAQGARLVTLTCVDMGGAFEVLYHFDLDLQLQHFSAQIPAGDKLPSITSEYLCAFLVENEIADLFGLQVEGLPVDYHNRLMLTEDSSDRPLLRER